PSLRTAAGGGTGAVLSHPEARQGGGAIGSSRERGARAGSPPSPGVFPRDPQTEPRNGEDPSVDRGRAPVLMNWVLDASLALAWALPDETSRQGARFLGPVARESDPRA